MTEIINNYLSPTNFSVSIQRLPNVEFFTQKTGVPGLTAAAVEMNAPTNPFYEVPQNISYSDLDLTFIVDENMNNYKEVLNWMEGIAGPESTDQTKSLLAAAKFKSDIILTITNSHKNPHVQFTFKDCFPTSLGGINFDVNVQDVSYATCSVTMRYDTFTMQQL
jgi:hypothetical protein